MPGSASRLARQLRFCLAAGTVVTLVTVGFLGICILNEGDEQAALATKTMLQGGVLNGAAQFAERTLDYAWLDANYRSYRRGDVNWMDETAGSDATDARIAGAMAIVEPSGRIEYGWIDHGHVGDLITDAVIADARVALKGVTAPSEGARTFHSRTSDGVLFAGAAPIWPREGSTADVAELPIIITARRLTPKVLSGFGHSFLIDDLRLVDAPIPGMDSDPIHDVDGNPIGYLAWAPPTPGRDSLRRVALPLGVAMILFLSVMVTIELRAKGLAAALVKAASQDYLTELDNRKGLSDFLSQPASQAALLRREMAIICIDVNGFKTVNNSVGHPGGDAVLRTVGTRLQEQMPPAARIARIGGNAFIVVLTLKEAAFVAGAARSVRTALCAPIEIDGVVFKLSASVGYATAEAGASAHEMIHRADRAMYLAKRTQSREPVAWEASMETDAAERKRMETRLRAGLDARELRVVYQPILRMSDMTVGSLEALVRWRSPEIGEVPADVLIRVAEESGLIRELGSYVLERVCEDLRRWPQTKVSVNLSPMQLRDPQLVDGVKATLRKHRVAPSQIEIELTETVLLDDPKAAAQKLSDFRSLGITVALDDFGVGFASIGSLRRFPIDRLKIDRSFLHGIEQPTKARDLLTSFVGVAKAMGLAVVCEGIETPLQAAIIRELDCEFGQGYLFSHPLEADDLEARLRNGPDFSPPLAIVVPKRA